MGHRALSNSKLSWPTGVRPSSWAQAPALQDSLSSICRFSSPRHLDGPHLWAMTKRRLLAHPGETLGYFGAASDRAMQFMRKTGFQGHPVRVVEQFFVRRVAAPGIRENVLREGGNRGIDLGVGHAEIGETHIGCFAARIVARGE